MKSVIVIGSGFAGLTAAALLARDGYKVTLLEKNDQPGGRARVWQQDGFTFDMGPSWYWMPEVFEETFGLFGKKVSDFYELIRLDPGYRIYFGEDDLMDVPAGMKELEALFEKLEPGSVPNLRKFLAQAEFKYTVGVGDYVHRPSHSITEFIDLKVIRESFRIQMFSSIRSHIRSLFTHPKLIELLEFPVLFLGSTPANTPALYSMMNYADLVLGTWYPKGGMVQIVKGLVKVCEDNGVDIRLNHEVTGLTVKNGKITSVETVAGSFSADIVIANSDYQHTEQVLLPEKYRVYKPEYWESRTMSPSSLLFFIGLDKKLDNMVHHTLFFDESFDRHAEAIYGTPRWPDKPLFYTSVSSKTDSTVAPEGKETLVILIPLAPGLKDSDEEREKQYKMVMDRLEKLTGQNVRDHVVLKRSYAMDDFTADYHSFKGNAYGLANTLPQTAVFKPKLKSKKVKNLWYTGQLTVPGPGVPPALISGQIVAKEVGKIKG